MRSAFTTRRVTTQAALALMVVCSVGCEPFASLFSRNVEALVRGPQRLPRRITEPFRPGAELAFLWVGHATVLVQVGDRFVLTDPVFTDTVAQYSTRLVEPGLSATDLPRVDLALLSHMHFDHLSYDSLDLIEARVGMLLVPEGGLVYVPNHAFPTFEVSPWMSRVTRALRATAVPVDHEGFRYGVDASWMRGGFTGWVIEHEGVTVFFGGDTAFDAERFQQVRARFPHIDVALLPIGPVQPREVMSRTHMDGREAVRAMLALGADCMIPIHYDTFAHGSDRPGEALEVLHAGVDEAGVDPNRVVVLRIGEQVVMRRRSAGLEGERLSTDGGHPSTAAGFEVEARAR
jgi:L-ascorbate metabolism protein UlaG (beta-lactamase superfamily)